MRHSASIGDINFDMSKENTLSNLCTTYDLKNLVCGPTCSKGAKSTALDVILSSEPKRFKHTINEPCFLSDFHNVICTVTKLLCPPVALDVFIIEVINILMKNLMYGI